MCESEAQWAMRKDRAVYQQRRQDVARENHGGAAFFQKNGEPNFSCTGMMRIGNPGDGKFYAIASAYISKI